MADFEQQRPLPHERPFHCSDERSSMPTSALLQLLPDREGRLPDVRWTLPVGELGHRALIARAAEGRRIECAELIGQNRFGQPLALGHRHTHVLPLDLDEDGWIEHLLVYVPAGMGPVARRAVEGLSWLRMSRAAFINSVRDQERMQRAIAAFPDLHLPVRQRTLFDSLGNPLPASSNPSHHALPQPSHHASSCRDLLTSSVPRFLSGSRHWRTITPLVPPRYLKRSGKNAVEGQIQSELRSRGFPLAAHIEVLARYHGTACSFHLERHCDKTPPPQRVAFSVALEFESPVRGPLALGYAAHFGLGLFQATTG